MPRPAAHLATDVEADPVGRFVSLISFCTLFPHIAGAAALHAGEQRFARCRFWRRMISRLNTISMLATLSRLIGRPSLAKATGSERLWSMGSR